jgi:hypothetical protein
MANLIKKSIYVLNIAGEKWADCSQCRGYLPAKSSYNGFNFCKDCLINNCNKGLLNRYR